VEQQQGEGHQPHAPAPPKKRKTYKPTVRQIIYWKVSPKARVIALVIRDHTDSKTEWAIGSDRSLAKDAKMGLNATDSAIRELRERGALQCEALDPKAGRFSKTKYRLHHHSDLYRGSSKKKASAEPPQD
jgi:hypothetical protein